MNGVDYAAIFIAGLNQEKVRQVMFALRDDAELSNIYYSTVYLVDELYTLITTEMRAVKKDVEYWQRLAESSELEIYLTQLHNKIYRDYIYKVIRVLYRNPLKMVYSVFVNKISFPPESACQSVSIHWMSKVKNVLLKLRTYFRDNLGINCGENEFEEIEDREDDVDRHLAVLQADLNGLAYLLATIDDAAVKLKQISSEVLAGYALFRLSSFSNGAVPMSSSISSLHSKYQTSTSQYPFNQLANKDANKDVTPLVTENTMNNSAKDNNSNISNLFNPMTESTKLGSNSNDSISHLPHSAPQHSPRPLKKSLSLAWKPQTHLHTRIRDLLTKCLIEINESFVLFVSQSKSSDLSLDLPTYKTDLNTGVSSKVSFETPGMAYNTSSKIIPNNKSMIDSPLINSQNNSNTSQKEDKELKIRKLERPPSLSALLAPSSLFTSSSKYSYPHPLPLANTFSKIPKSELFDLYYQIYHGITNVMNKTVLEAASGSDQVRTPNTLLLILYCYNINGLLCLSVAMIFVFITTEIDDDYDYYVVILVSCT